MRDDFADAQLLQEADLLVRELGFLMEEVKAYSLLAIQLREPQFATEGERHAFQGSSYSYQNEEKKKSPFEIAPENTLRKKRGRKPLDKSNLVCYHCKTTDTPEWRKGPAGKNTLCNACGLQYAKRVKLASERCKGKMELNDMLNPEEEGEPKKKRRKTS